MSYTRENLAVSDSIVAAELSQKLEVIFEDANKIMDTYRLMTDPRYLRVQSDYMRHLVFYADAVRANQEGNLPYERNPLGWFEIAYDLSMKNSINEPGFGHASRNQFWANPVSEQIEADYEDMVSKRDTDTIGGDLIDNITSQQYAVMVNAGEIMLTDTLGAILSRRRHGPFSFPK